MSTVLTLRKGQKDLMKDLMEGIVEDLMKDLKEDFMEGIMEDLDHKNQGQDLIIAGIVMGCVLVPTDHRHMKSTMKRTSTMKSRIATTTSHVSTNISTGTTMTIMATKKRITLTKTHLPITKGTRCPVLRSSTTPPGEGTSQQISATWITTTLTWASMETWSWRAGMLLTSSLKGTRRGSRDKVKQTSVLPLVLLAMTRGRHRRSPFKQDLLISLNLKRSNLINSSTIAREKALMISSSSQSLAPQQLMASATRFTTTQWTRGIAGKVADFLRDFRLRAATRTAEEAVTQEVFLVPRISFNLQSPQILTTMTSMEGRVPRTLLKSKQALDRSTTGPQDTVHRGKVVPLGWDVVLQDLVPCSLVREAHIGVDHQEGGTGSTGISSVGGRGDHHPYDLGFKIFVVSLALVVTKYITLSMLPNKLINTVFFGLTGGGAADDPHNSWFP